MLGPARTPILNWAPSCVDAELGIAELLKLSELKWLKAWLSKCARFNWRRQLQTEQAYNQKIYCHKSPS